MMGLAALGLLCLVAPASALTVSPERQISSDVEQGSEKLGEGSAERWSNQSSYRVMSFNGSDWSVRGHPARTGKPRTPWVVSTPQCPAPKGAESWSQNGEDQHLYHNYFCGKRNGTFVEMGALDVGST